MAEQHTNDLSQGNAEPPVPEPRIVTEQASAAADGLNVPVDPAAFSTTGERHETPGTTQEMPPAPAPGPTPGFDPKKEKEQSDSNGKPNEPQKPSRLKNVGFVIALIAALAIGYALGSQRSGNMTGQQPLEQQNANVSSSDASSQNDGDADVKSSVDKQNSASNDADEDAAQSDSQQNTSASDATDEDTSNQTDASDTSASNPFDVSTLAGEKWANAKKILASNDIGLDDVIVLTDDGKQVIVDSNWSVEDAFRRGKSITVKLKHDTDNVKDAGDALGNLFSNLTGGDNKQ